MPYVDYIYHLRHNNYHCPTPPSHTLVNNHQPDELFTALTAKLAPMWTFRFALKVSNGISYALAGSWCLRLGDVRITAGPGAG